MDKRLRDLFFETIKDKLMFLVLEHGFTGPYSNLDSTDSSYVLIVWYMKTNLAIEFHLEVRDEDISCYVARLANGKRPVGWLVNEQGERIRIRLSQWIRGADNKKRLFTRVTGLNLEQRIPIQISDCASLLEKFGQVFLKDSLDMFLPRK